MHALVIKADEDYIFYGNGIQVDNIQEAYERLKYDISEYQQSLERQIGLETRQKTMLPKLPKVTVPKLSAPKLELPKIDFSRKKDPAASVVYMAIDSAKSYAVYKRETGMQFIQDGWSADDEVSKTLHESRKGKFSYNAEIMRLLVFCKRLFRDNKERTRQHS